MDTLRSRQGLEKLLGITFAKWQIINGCFFAAEYTQYYLKTFVRATKTCLGFNICTYIQATIIRFWNV